MWRGEVSEMSGDAYKTERGDCMWARLSFSKTFFFFFCWHHWSMTLRFVFKHSCLRQQSHDTQRWKRAIRNYICEVQTEHKTQGPCRIQRAQIPWGLLSEKRFPDKTFVFHLYMLLVNWIKCFSFGQGPILRKACSNLGALEGTALARKTHKTHLTINQTIESDKR